MALCGKRGHILSKLLITVETSNIVPRGGAPSHGKTTSGCGTPLSAGTRPGSARVRVKRATVMPSLEPRLHSTSRAHLCDSCTRGLRFRRPDPDCCGVFRSSSPSARKKFRNFDTVSTKHLKIFCCLNKCQCYRFCLHTSVTTSDKTFKILRRIFNFTLSLFHQFKINHRREFIILKHTPFLLLFCCFE
jgi:hypothetical protein